MARACLTGRAGDSDATQGRACGVWASWHGVRVFVSWHGVRCVDSERAGQRVAVCRVACVVSRCACVCRACPGVPVRARAVCRVSAWRTRGGTPCPGVVRCVGMTRTGQARQGVSVSRSQGRQAASAAAKAGRRPAEDGGGQRPSRALKSCRPPAFRGVAGCGFGHGWRLQNGVLTTAGDSPALGPASREARSPSCLPRAVALSLCGPCKHWVSLGLMAGRGVEACAWWWAVFW